MVPKIGGNVDLQGQSNLAKGGLKRLNITIKLWHHLDFVHIHLGGLTLNFLKPAFLLLI